MTEEEVQQKIEEAKAEAAAAAEAALKAKDEEIEGLKNKDTNFANLRKQAEEAKKEAEEANARIAALESERVELPKKESLSVRVGEDKELEEKVLAEYEKTGKDAKTPEEIDKAMDDAYLIVTGKRYNADVIGRGMSSAGGFRAPVRGAGNASLVDPLVKDFAAEFNRHGAGIDLETDLGPDSEIVKSAAKKRADHEGR